MAVESEPSSLPKLSKPEDLPVAKTDLYVPDQSEDMEEDELQMESGETIDDSGLKLNITDLEESRDQDKQPQDTSRYVSLGSSKQLTYEYSFSIVFLWN